MKKSFIFLVLFMFLICLGFPYKAKAKGWAVLVGIDKYSDPGISILNGAGNDAKSLAKTLKTSLGFPEDQILVYTGGSGTGGSDKAYLPTTGRIVKGLKYVAKKAGKKDLFVFAFSGHGISKSNKSYLLTYNSEPGAFEQTAMNISQLNELIDKISCQKKLLIFDACRNDPEKGRGDKDNLLTKSFSKGIRIMSANNQVLSDYASSDRVLAKLFSCDLGQRSYEMPGKNRGFFSFYLEKGLLGKAVDDNGNITLAGIVSYLREQVPKNLQLEMGVDKKQSPFVQMEGGDPGKWILNNIKGKDWQKIVEQKKKEMDRLSALEAKQSQARQKQKQEEKKHQKKIAGLDEDIQAMRKRLGSSVQESSDSLENLLAMVREKEDQGKKLAQLKKQRQDQEKQRQLEIERIKKEQREKKLKALEKSLGTYDEIASSEYGKDLKDQAWSQVLKDHGVSLSIKTGDKENLRHWVAYGKLLLPGNIWKDPVTGMEFVWVPEGCFQMGSNSNEAAVEETDSRPATFKYIEGDPIDWSYLEYELKESDTEEPPQNDEKPVHKVCVDGFWMGKYEVTIDQYRKFLKDQGSDSGVDWTDGDCPINKNNFFTLKGNKFGSDGAQPMVEVSWNGAKSFCNWLSKKTGQTFKLPTEAQWEYAARSGGKNEKYAGSSSPDRVAWYESNSGDKTHRVGTKASNGLGVYDMSGNVWEWCEDVYGSNAYSKHKRNNPLITSGGKSRVIRGGSWFDYSRYVRVANRFGDSADDSSSNLGFRLCSPSYGDTLLIYYQDTKTTGIIICRGIWTELWGHLTYLLSGHENKCHYYLPWDLDVTSRIYYSIGTVVGAFQARYN